MSFFQKVKETWAPFLLNTTISVALARIFIHTFPSLTLSNGFPSQVEITWDSKLRVWLLIWWQVTNLQPLGWLQLKKSSFQGGPHVDFHSPAHLTPSAYDFFLTSESPIPLFWERRLAIIPFCHIPDKLISRRWPLTLGRLLRLVLAKLLASCSSETLFLGSFSLSKSPKPRERFFLTLRLVFFFNFFFPIRPSKVGNTGLIFWTWNS